MAPPPQRGGILLNPLFEGVRGRKKNHIMLNLVLNNKNIEKFLCLTT